MVLKMLKNLLKDLFFIAKWYPGTEIELTENAIKSIKEISSENEMIKWISKNIKGEYHYNLAPKYGLPNFICFSRESDAMLFKLVWC